MIKILVKGEGKSPFAEGDEADLLDPLVRTLFKKKKSNYNVLQEILLNIFVLNTCFWQLGKIQEGQKLYIVFKIHN